MIEIETLKAGILALIEMCTPNLAEDERAYFKDFQEDLHKSTQLYYRSLSTEKFTTLNTIDYINFVYQEMDNEKKRCDELMHIDEYPNIRKIMIEEFVNRLAIEILENETHGYLYMLRNNLLDQLTKVYILFNEITNGKSMIVQIFQRHVAESAQVQIDDFNLELEEDNIVDKKKADKKSGKKKAIENPSTNHLAVELRADRVAQIFARTTILSSKTLISNLVVVGGDSGFFLSKSIIPLCP